MKENENDFLEQQLKESNTGGQGYRHSKASEFLNQLSAKEQHQLKRKMFAAIRTDIKRKEKRVARIKMIRRLAAVAVTMVSLLLVHLFTWNSIRKQDHEFRTGANEKLTVELMDGTVVVLNSSSKLSYQTSSAFGFNRKVKLDGEAYFEVAKMGDGKRFIINEGSDLEVEVFGTAFSFKNQYPVHKLTLLEGSVSLGYKSENGENKQLVNPGETIRFDPVSQTIRSKVVPDPRSLLSWKESRIELKDSSLSEVIDVIAEIYDMNVIAGSDQEMNSLVSGHIPISDDPDPLAENISELFKRDVKIENNTIQVQ